MSFQWTFIACYLYLEIGIVTILIMPVASPRRWSRIFRSRAFAWVFDRAAFYFYVLLMVLGLVLTDAVREMRKYSHVAHDSGGLALEMKGSIKLFRAQRNFYITGFAIFLAFVIRRLVNMILLQADLIDKSEIIVKEAKLAKDLAKDVVNSVHRTGAGELQAEAAAWRDKYHELLSQTNASHN